MNYFVTGPVPGGNAWWEVHAMTGYEYENFIVASFFRDLPEAEKLANDLCDKLNKK